MRNLIVTVTHDPDADPPTDWDGSASVYTFGRSWVRGGQQHTDRGDWQAIDDDGDYVRSPAAPDVADLFRFGMAHWLMESGDRLYPAADPLEPWGVLVCDSPEPMVAMTEVERLAYARQFLATYNAWLNGEVYGYSVDTVDGTHVDSCWGFYAHTDDDRKYLSDTAFGCLEPGDRFVIDGDAADAVLPGRAPDGTECVMEDAADFRERVEFERHEARELAKDIDPLAATLPDPVLHDWWIEHDREDLAAILQTH